ncbi:MULTISPECIES: hypothetical protein [unclassified Aeromonas]|uniref:hypothetical protein n=1 Tax=unclassified Aeromonas TaxID=257493 RepID=UPI0022DFD619|nr:MULTISPECIES: hypothetical protein [unclassified Aeromonas]
MEQKAIACWVKIIDPNGTYFEKGSVLPVHLNDDFEPVLTEEYEPGEPCEHSLDDLTADGVTFEKVSAPEQQS